LGSGAGGHWYEGVVTETSSAPTAQDEVVGLCRDLLRIDTTNTGDTATSAGERVAAEYVAAQLSDVGLEPTVLESEPTRTSVIVRIPGQDRGRDALLIHGHLDVVPADASEWSVDPFAGEERDGYLWGRGAIDMKDMDAMMLGLARQWARNRTPPPRDVVMAFLADEEAGGAKGARWLVENHAGLFEGCTEAIGEVGGYSVTLGDQLRLYLIQTAEKGMAWTRLKARGVPGHGSMVHRDNAVTAVAEAVARIGRHEFPRVVTETLRAFILGLGEATGTRLDPDAPDTLDNLAAISKMIAATLSNTVNPTMLTAGYKANVIPGSAEAVVDGRFLPGQEVEFEKQLDELLGPSVHREWIEYHPAVETSFDGPLVEQMIAALRAEDPYAFPVPYLMSGGTDAKHFARLGMRCFGYSPLLLPPDLDFAGLFHGIDERVPVDALKFGVRVLDRLVMSS
jgi:acetylornithine deacetylase/succinyl-diaminopimelate desuccinylase-like protein